MNRKHKKDMKQDRGQEEVKTQEEGGNMTISQATKKWNAKFPGTPVTEQTIRNWTAKFGLGTKCSFLPRSRWSVQEDKFDQFLKDPEKFLVQNRGKKGK